MTSTLNKAPQRHGPFDSRWYLVPVLYAAISMGGVMLLAHEVPQLDAARLQDKTDAPATAPMLWIV